MPSFLKKNTKEGLIERVDITLIYFEAGLPALIHTESIKDAMGGLHSA